MAYALHIERQSNELTLEEWISAVGRIENARLATGNSKITNPKTGEVISIESSPGDVDVLFSTKGFLRFCAKSEWSTCIRFSRGKGTFNAPPDIEESNNPVRVTASKLAHLLGAKIIGDEGEVYEW